jgi:hypothetical protein
MWGREAYGVVDDVPRGTGGTARPRRGTNRSLEVEKQEVMREPTQHAPPSDTTMQSPCTCEWGWQRHREWCEA